jgi:hypothetical protein
VNGVESAGGASERGWPSWLTVIRPDTPKERDRAQRLTKQWAATWLSDMVDWIRVSGGELVEVLPADSVPVSAGHTCSGAACADVDPSAASRVRRQSPSGSPTNAAMRSISRCRRSIDSASSAICSSRRLGSISGNREPENRPTRRAHVPAVTGAQSGPAVIRFDSRCNPPCAPYVRSLFGARSLVLALTLCHPGFPLLSGQRTVSGFGALSLVHHSHGVREVGLTVIHYSRIPATVLVHIHEKSSGSNELLRRAGGASLWWPEHAVLLDRVHWQRGCCARHGPCLLQFFAPTTDTRSRAGRPRGVEGIASQNPGVIPHRARSMFR